MPTKKSPAQLQREIDEVLADKPLQTANTITDEQLYELTADRDLLTACIASVAVGEMHPRVQQLTFAKALEMSRYAGSRAARARCAEILNERKRAEALAKLTVRLSHEDGTRNRLGKLLASVAKSEPSGFATRKTADIEALLSAGYIAYGLHPRGGHRANITRSGLDALANS